MKNFKPIGISINKYQAGTNQGGIFPTQYKGPQYSQIRDQMKKDNPEDYNQLQIEVARQQQPNSEIIGYMDANGRYKTTTNTGAGYVSGADPVGQMLVEGAVLNKPLQWAGKLGLYGLGRAGNNWARAKLISNSMQPNLNEIKQVNNLLRNKEWHNHLATINGDNYYRLQRTSKIPSGNIPEEKLFVSHTTPWEEFVPMNTNIDVPNSGFIESPGNTTLYEFPTKVFGVKKGTNHLGFQGDIDVNTLGKQHLLYGDHASGSRGLVRIISDKNAQMLGIDSHTIGIKERPLTSNKFYDKNPIYEDIHQGNQTVIESEKLRDAMLNDTYTKYEHSPYGIVRTINVGKQR